MANSKCNFQLASYWLTIVNGWQLEFFLVLKTAHPRKHHGDAVVVVCVDDDLEQDRAAWLHSAFFQPYVSFFESFLNSTQ